MLVSQLNMFLAEMSIQDVCSFFKKNFARFKTVFFFFFLSLSSQNFIFLIYI